MISQINYTLSTHSLFVLLLLITLSVASPTTSLPNNSRYPTIPWHHRATTLLGYSPRTPCYVARAADLGSHDLQQKAVDLATPGKSEDAVIVWNVGVTGKEWIRWANRIAVQMNGININMFPTETCGPARNRLIQKSDFDMLLQDMAGVVDKLIWSRDAKHLPSEETLYCGALGYGLTPTFQWLKDGFEIQPIEQIQLNDVAIGARGRIRLRLSYVRVPATAAQGTYTCRVKTQTMCQQFGKEFSSWMGFEKLIPSTHMTPEVKEPIRDDYFAKPFTHDRVSEVLATTPVEIVNNCGTVLSHLYRVFVSRICDGMKFGAKHTVLQSSDLCLVDEKDTTLRSYCYGLRMFSCNGYWTQIRYSVVNAVVECTLASSLCFEKLCNDVDVDYNDDCYFPFANYFSKKLNHSRTGKKCLNWRTQCGFYSLPTHLSKRFPENGCSNFGSARERPWCYVEEGPDLWEYCDVDECPVDAEGNIRLPDYNLTLPLIHKVNSGFSLSNIEVFENDPVLFKNTVGHTCNTVNQWLDANEPHPGVVKCGSSLFSRSSRYDNLVIFALSLLAICISAVLVLIYCVRRRVKPGSLLADVRGRMLSYLHRHVVRQNPNNFIVRAWWRMLCRGNSSSLVVSCPHAVPLNQNRVIQLEPDCCHLLDFGVKNPLFGAILETLNNGDSAKFGIVAVDGTMVDRSLGCLVLSDNREGKLSANMFEYFNCNSSPTDFDCGCRLESTPNSADIRMECHPKYARNYSMMGGDGRKAVDANDAGGQRIVSAFTAAYAWAPFRGLFAPVSVTHPFSCLELDRARLRCIRTLGRGAFGDVLLAKYSHSVDPSAHDLSNDLMGPTEELVAVKVLHDSVSSLGLDSLQLEAKMLMCLCHPNLIKLIGVCWNSYPRCLVYEYMEMGDLKEFLWTCSPYHHYQRDSYSSSLPSATNEIVNDGSEVGGEVGLSLSQKVLIGLKIATGMKYLGDQGWVHRDLAARNILVGRDLKVKIADFGMARMVEPGSGTFQGPATEDIPVRWCSPESINRRIFSSASDVWSFAVVLWEILTLGMRPYAGFTHAEVVQFVSTGGTLECPQGAPAPVYGLMKSCWAIQAADRPSFETVLQFLVLCK